MSRLKMCRWTSKDQVFDEASLIPETHPFILCFPVNGTAAIKPGVLCKV